MEEKDIKNNDKNEVDKKDSLHRLLFLISLSLYIISLLVLISWLFKIMVVDKKITENNLILLATFVLSIIFLRFFILHKNLEKMAQNYLGVTILRCEINDKQVKEGDDILLEGIEITNPNNIGVFNIHIELADKFSELLKLIIYKTLNSKIVSEESKVIKDGFDFEIVAKPGEMLNLKLEKAGMVGGDNKLTWAIIKRLTVIETYLP